MAPRLPWSNLVPGLIALAAILMIAIGVIMFAGVGRVRGDTMRLYVRSDQARGLMKGSDVWLAGQKVGVVDHVGFSTPGSDTAARVVIAISVREKDAGQIRKDSHAQVRAGANVVGPIVVYLSSGTPTSPPAREGDTLRARPQSDFEVAGTKLDAATQELGPLLADARAVMGHVRNPNGTIGAAIQERGGGRITRLRATVSRLRQRMASGNEGQPGPRTVMAHARDALARVDSVRALLRSNESSYGRFRRDSTLGRSIATLRDELAELRAQLAAHDGTIARFESDSALSRAIANAQREMTLLFDDIRRRPLRYVAF